MTLYKIFNTPFGKKIYSPITNEIKDITEQLASFIASSTLVNDINCTDNKLLNEYKELEREGFLEENILKFNNNPLSEYLIDFLERKVSHFVLQTTQDCNLRCSYCSYTENDGFQRKHLKRNMDKNTAFKALEFLRQNSIDSNEIRISFYGGEPLINYELIEAVVRKANKVFRNKNLNFNVITNGTILNKRILEFLQLHNVKLTISLDGRKDVHDANRVFKNSTIGSFDTIKKNIYLMETEFPELFNNLSINTVMDPKQPFSGYSEIYDEIPVLDNTLITADIVDDLMSMTKTQYEKSFMGPYEYEKFLTIIEVLKGNSYQGKICYSHVKQLEGIVERFNSGKMGSRLIPSGPCMPGYKKVFVDVNGIFYPCEKVRETSKCMRIGDVEQGWNYDAIEKQLNIHLLTKEQCQNCWAFRLCDSCVLFADGGDMLSPRARLNFCEENKNNALYKLNYYVAHNELMKTRGYA